MRGCWRKIRSASDGAAPPSCCGRCRTSVAIAAAIRARAAAPNGSRACRAECAMSRSAGRGAERRSTAHLQSALPRLRTPGGECQPHPRAYAAPIDSRAWRAGAAISVRREGAAERARAKTLLRPRAAEFTPARWRSPAASLLKLPSPATRGPGALASRSWARRSSAARSAGTAPLRSQTVGVRGPGGLTARY